ncbi:MFS transporter [Streptacidiphilus sp. 4-A2]|nr:MFS transporter [Streptacidiphilus sp. 4-A2]
MLRHSRFRRFLLGQTTSLLGSGMNTIGTTFALLRLPGGGTNAVGLVMAVRILAILAVLLLGGVLTDRLGARSVMLTADLLRFAAQGILAGLLLTDSARLWEVAVLGVLLGIGEGGFGPGLSALVPGLVATEDLMDANALLQTAKAIASVAGPGLAGLLLALSGPGSVVAIDAASYGVSVLALAGLRLTQPATPRRGLLSDLGRGWTEFASRTWLWVSTVHITLFNFVLWAPFLVLGPALAQQRLGGASSWGVVLALYGAGSIGAAWPCSAGARDVRSLGPWQRPSAGLCPPPPWPRACRSPGWQQQRSPRDRCSGVQHAALLRHPARDPRRGPWTDQRLQRPGCVRTRAARAGAGRPGGRIRGRGSPAGVRRDVATHRGRGRAGNSVRTTERRVVTCVQASESGEVRQAPPGAGPKRLSPTAAWVRPWRDASARSRRSPSRRPSARSAVAAGRGRRPGRAPVCPRPSPGARRRPGR